MSRRFPQDEIAYHIFLGGYSVTSMTIGQMQTCLEMGNQTQTDSTFMILWVL